MQKLIFMFKELLKYMVIGVVAGIASYLVIIEKPVSIKVDEISSVCLLYTSDAADEP